MNNPRPATTSPRARTSPAPRLGLRQNAAQFTLLVVVNALVGGMLGQERTVVPLLGEREFGLRAYTAGLTFIVAFGLSKAVANYLAGTLSDRYGRKSPRVRGLGPAAQATRGVAPWWWSRR